MSETAIGGELLEASNISGNQRDVALRICYALRDKRVYYRSNYLNKVFGFKVINRDCSGNSDQEEISAILTATLTSSPMFYNLSESDMDFKREVMTDRQGDLVSICNSLFKGREISNLISDLGTTRMQVNFLESTGSGDQFMFLTAIKNTEGQYIVSERSSYFVHTEDKYKTLPEYGHIYKVVESKTCDSGTSSTEVDTLEQNTEIYPTFEESN
ncbi:MAG: hypothetical protein ACPGJV_00300 [Bacteriovoracaceae bacterium]